MVGDDLLCDVDGALRVGMRAIWKRNGKAHRDLGSVEPTAIVDSLAELQEVLSSSEFLR